MELKGQAKEDFEQWAVKNDNYTLVNGKFLAYKFKESTDWKYWEDIPFSMRYGVYVDWLDEQGIYIDKTSNGEVNIRFVFDFYTANEYCLKSRKESREWAIAKANEIYNENN
jgi:hypothetical protein